jgi:hypothetical protein
MKINETDSESSECQCCVESLQTDASKITTSVVDEVEISRLHNCELILYFLFLSFKKESLNVSRFCGVFEFSRRRVERDELDGIEGYLVISLNDFH